MFLPLLPSSEYVFKYLMGLVTSIWTVDCKVWHDGKSQGRCLSLTAPFSLRFRLQCTPSSLPPTVP